MMSTYEKIETIVLARMANPESRGGTCGTLIEKSPCRYHVYADGSLFFVNTCELGWEVTKAGSNMVGMDAELIEAARKAINH
jgi:hypothetical protein